MFTKYEKVEATAQIWAIPRQSWEPAENPPFSYRLYCNGSPYTDGAVKVADAPISAFVPEGINLLQAALETLEDAKVKARQTYIEQCAKIDKQIEGLRQLTYQAPSAESVELQGEVLPPDSPVFDDDIPF